MQLQSDSPLVSSVPLASYVEVLRGAITKHDRSVSLPACFVSRISVEGCADEMLVALSIHQWLRNQGTLESDGSVLAHISRYEKLIYQVSAVKNNLLIQSCTGKKVFAAAYIPNIRTLRAIHCSLSDDDVMQFSGMISNLLAATAQKRRQWQSKKPITGFINARYAVRG